MPSQFWRLGAAFLATLIAAAVLFALPASAAPSASHAPSAQPPGWFLQTSTLFPTYTPDAVADWVREACAASPSARPSLVLQDVVDGSGELATQYLDRIAPYLPGGKQACVGQLFVGTVEPNWTGQGSAYVEGVSDPSFRAQFAAQSESIARQFVHRYPFLRFNWYITYEANLNQLYYSGVRKAYADLLNKVRVGLDSVRAGRDYLWSPAFWFPYSSYKTNTAGMQGLRRQLATLFKGAATHHQRLTVDLQDFVSGSSCEPAANRVTASDAAHWERFLAAVQGAPPVTLNVEQYRIDCATGGMTAASSSALAQRMSVYSAKRIPLGPAFALEYQQAGS